jgi:hypothetical protein
MPSMPPPPMGASFFSGISATRASVVSINDAIEPALVSAVRTTFVGSSTPALTRSSYSLVKGSIRENSGRFSETSTKGGHVGRPKLSLVETTRFAPYNQIFALSSADVKMQRALRQNLGVAPVRLELTTFKVRN